MDTPDSIEVSFSSPDFDISKVLQPQVRQGIATATGSETFLLARDAHGDLSQVTVLEQGQSLSREHLSLVKQLVETPEAWCDGVFFRRPPGVPEFAIQLTGGEQSVDIMLDLQNPWWSFHCGKFQYDWFHNVPDHLLEIARASFPQYAATERDQPWKPGAIARLKALRSLKKEPLFLSEELVSRPLFAVSVELWNELQQHTVRRSCEICDRYQAVVLDGGLGCETFLTQDGRIIWADAHDWGLTGTMKDALMSLTAGIRRTEIELLSTALPPKPEDAMPCESCSGSGWVEVEVSSVTLGPYGCADCGVLGWTSASIDLAEIVVDSNFSQPYLPEE